MQCSVDGHGKRCAIAIANTIISEGLAFSQWRLTH